MKTLLLLCLSFALIAGCSSNAAREYDAESLQIELTRTECFGKCPAFTLRISGDGLCQLEGKKNIDKIGKYELTLPKDKIAELARAIDDCNPFSLENEYTANITDLPTTTLFVKLDGKSKKIRDYYGAPDKLRQLEEKVDSIRKLDGWTKSK